MSNRFADCETTWAVLGDFRRLDVVDANDQDDALARIRELTPPPAVSEEARERAKTVVYDAMMEARRIGPNVPAAHRWLDRIIDALGYTPAPDGDDAYPDAEYADWVERTALAASASLPVVELDATAVRRFIDGAQTLIGGLNSRITMIRDGQEWSLYSDGVDFVLRIGGTDE